MRGYLCYYAFHSNHGLQIRVLWMMGQQKVVSRIQILRTILIRAFSFRNLGAMVYGVLVNRNRFELPGDESG